LTENTLTLLKEMVSMQEEHNRKVDENWRTTGFAYRRAVWMECAELIDQIGWKWWAAQPSPDRQQLVFELVDIWHFGLSMLLLDETPVEALAVRLDEDFHREPATDDLVEAVEGFVAATLGSESFLLERFVELCACFDVSFYDLYTCYMGKNVLNQFRQDHGYKAGHYKKLWQGREDNQYLAELLEHHDLSTRTGRKALYQALAQAYQDA